MKTDSQHLLANWQHNQDYEFGDLLVYYLEQLEIDYVFGIPGGAIVPLFNALARSEKRGGLRAIVSRHETDAAFMADGYHAQTGKLGVCCATTGPGTTNLVTGVASAHANNVPMLIITAQSALPKLGEGAFQDSSCTGIDSVGLFKHITLYSTLVSHPNQLESKLITAITTAFGPQPGPVHLSIPLDVLSAPAQRKSCFNIKRQLRQPKLFDPDDIDTLEKTLTKNHSTTFVIGKSAASAISQIINVAERIGATLIATPHGKGLISPFHPQFRGILGYGGHRTAIESLQRSNCTAIICVGTLMSERAGNSWLKKISPEQTLIHIDQIETHFAHTPMAHHHIKGCTASIFEQLMHRLTTPKNSRYAQPSRLPLNINSPKFTLDDEKAFNSGATPIKPQRLMRELPKIFPENTTFLADSGSSLAWALHYLHPNNHNQKKSIHASNSYFHATLEFTSMGWAISAAIGCAFGSKDPVVCITGDGSLLMSGQEISIAVKEQLPVVFIVLNDSCFGMIKHGLRMINAEPVGFDMPPTNFSALAQAMGARAYTLKGVDDFKKLDPQALFKAKVPTLLDVHIDPEEVPPFGNRIRTLTE